MAELKTKKTTASAAKFIDTVADPKRRADAKVLLKLFKEVTKKPPVMWGTAIVGYGQYHYKSERSTQEGDWPKVGFSPRKQNLTLYVGPNFPKVKPLLKKLGKHKSSVGCVYVNKLEDIDLDVLRKIVKECLVEMDRRYP